MSIGGAPESYGRSLAQMVSPVSGGIGVRTTLTGDKELIKTFSALPPALQRRALRPLLRSAARPLVTTARAELKKNMQAHGTMKTRKVYRKKHGGAHLYQSIGVALRTYPRKGSVYLALGPLWKEGGYHGHLVEKGHRIARGGTLIRKQPEGWTNEMVWNKKLGILVYKHGAPRREGKSKVTGIAGGGKTIGRVPGYPFMAPALAAMADKVISDIAAGLGPAMDKVVQSVRKGG